MIYTILIFLFIIVILSINVNLSFMSVNDTFKVYFKIGFMYFLIPHQRILEKKKLNSKEEVINFINKRKLIRCLLKHSSLDEFYVSRFRKEELYINPVSNGFYYIIVNQIKGVLSNLFKRIDNGKIELIYNEKYENVDYFVKIKTDVISIIVSLFESKLKG